MTNPHPRGSEWRKWDLHVHVPGTKLCDGFEPKNGAPDLDLFAEKLEASDVAVIGITDYFSAAETLAFIKHFKQKYPDSDKLLLVNVELRLNETVNRDLQTVDFHVIFRDSVPEAKITEFLNRLPTQLTDTQGRPKACSELAGNDFNTATVTRADIRKAFKETFGERAETTDFLIYLAPANNNGLRAEAGKQRKSNLADEIDKEVHAIFGKDTDNSEWYLRTDRFDDTTQSSEPKPVFGGCDAHSFNDLDSWLGKAVEDESTRQVITWIKADPTYAGLLQTLIEPAERVSLHAPQPDQKEPYRVISKVSFAGTDDFPSEVLLNRNLNSIIGSRSSGKSALLAFIAHAVDPAETVRVQAEAARLQDESEAGPAAGFTWSKVSGVSCEVEWESGASTSGKVIYIPQNSLYTLSEQPDEITKKIAPALFRTYPTVKTAYDSAKSKTDAANTEIKASIDEWFSLDERIAERTKEIQDLGDKAAITAERARLQREVEAIKTAAKLTDEEVAKYQEVAGDLDAKQSRLREISIELDQLSSYVTLTLAAAPPAIIPQTVQATVTVRPSSVEVPDATATQVESLKAEAVNDLVVKIETALVESVRALEAEQAAIEGQVQAVRAENAELIAKHEANEELAAVVAEHKKQVASLDEIARREKSRDKLIADQKSAVDRVANGIKDRGEAWAALENNFTAEPRVLTDLTFGIEAAVTAEAVTHASNGLSQRSTSDYVKSKGDEVSYQDAQTDPGKFLRALRDGTVKLNKSFEPNAVAADVLTITKEVRFTAELDTDRIGGFSRSSMTPGKQALFALTLILNESQEPWPLLIDQPEDDLDSRSIYETIVPYLMKRKKERQIIMVSHNANLVIGADSELVVVANRHGADRKNHGDRTFEYFTGALEHSQALNAASPTTLGRFGIREHACEILDGGEEAFQKRQEKYKIRAAGGASGS